MRGLPANQSEAGLVVVAVDGTEAALASLEWAVAWARLGRHPLRGLFIWDAGWPDFIGNDWQSSQGARQGFLDHVQQAVARQQTLAQAQFQQMVGDLPWAEFLAQSGDPLTLLLAWASDPQVALLVLGRRTFQVCGRPSLVAIPGQIVKRASRPLMVLP